MEKTGINYEYVPERETDTIKIVKYETPSKLLEFLSGIDLLVTSKLHLGISGLPLGTPFLIYRGPGKAKTFLQSIGGEWAVLNDNISFQELEKKFFRKSKSEIFNKYNIKLLNKMIKDSFGHYLFCKNIIEQFS